MTFHMHPPKTTWVTKSLMYTSINSIITLNSLFNFLLRLLGSWNPYLNSAFIAAVYGYDRSSIYSLAHFEFLDYLIRKGSTSDSNGDIQCPMVGNLGSCMDLDFEGVMLFHHCPVLEWEDSLLPIGWLT